MLRPRLRTATRAARLLSSGLGPSPGAARSIPAAILNHRNRRSLHHVPSLQHDYAEGVPGLMSPAGFNVAWTDNMTFLIEKLNALTAGTELEDKDTKTIALMTAREPVQAPIFNYASMAHNTHFFFQGISPTGSPMSDELRSELQASFSSIETLRREFVITAAAMFGPGFLWLVRAGPGEYRLLPTYLAGSPYPGAHWRAQSADMNTLGAEGSARSYFQNQTFGSRRRPTQVSPYASSASAELPPGGIDLQPLLCLSTWEHAWLLDWGAGSSRGNGGKTAFTEAWWDIIDWETVHQRAGMDRPALKGAEA